MIVRSGPLRRSAGLCEPRLGRSIRCVEWDQRLVMSWSVKDRTRIRIQVNGPCVVSRAPRGALVTTHGPFDLNANTIRSAPYRFPGARRTGRLGHGRTCDSASCFQPLGRISLSFTACGGSAVSLFLSTLRGVSSIQGARGPEGAARESTETTSEVLGDGSHSCGAFAQTNSQAEAGISEVCASQFTKALGSNSPRRDARCVSAARA